MTNQIDSSSPFIGAAGGSQKAPEPAEEFSIRTMQDDLEALQKKGGQPQSAQPIVAEPKPIIKAPVKIPEKIENFVPEPPKKQVAPAPKETASASTPIKPGPAAPKIVEKVPLPKPEDFGEEPIYIRPSLDKKPIPVKTGNAAYKIAMTVLIVLIMGVIGLGGYYFWSTRTPKQTEQQPIETPQQDQTPVVIVPPVDKYSAEKPNYLPLDLATLFPEDIKKAINDITPDLGAKSSQLPYEFVVVDTTNAPVAFSAFAAAAKLNLSSATLNDLGTNFSLYLYNDNGAGVFRFAVAIDITKKDTLQTALTKEEKTFSTDADFLFLGAKPETAASIFSSNIYNGTSVRYINFANQQPLSIDYAIADTRLVIATSRYTMHAVLDKLAIEKSAAQATPAIQQVATDSAAETTATADTASNTPDANSSAPASNDLPAPVQ